MVWLQCLYSFFTVLRLWVVEGVLFTSSVNYCAQTCVWCIQWMPYAPNLWLVHHWDAQYFSCAHLDLIPLQCIKTLVGASQWVEHQKSMCESHVNRRKWLYRCSSCLIFSGEVKKSQIMQQAWEMWIFIFRNCWDAWHLMWAFENSWWPLAERKHISHVNCGPLNFED